MRVQLKILRSDGKSQLGNLQGECISIGRDPDCDLCVEDSEQQIVSWVHSRLEVEGENVVVRDFHSKNGTFLNDERVEGAVELHVGDAIRLGQKGPRLIVLKLDTADGDSGERAGTQGDQGSTSTAEQSVPRQPPFEQRILWLASCAAVIVLVLVTSLVWLSSSSSRPERKEEPLASTPPEPTRAEPVFDELVWSQADFVLINPGHKAVAVQAVDKRGSAFKVTGKAENNEAQRAMEIAWNDGVPIIDNEKRLARQLYAQAKVGIPAPLQFASGLKSLWQEQPAMPEPKAAEWIVFDDLQRGRRRVGVRLEHAAEGFEFQEINSSQTEHIDPALIQTGSMKRIHDDEQLRAEIDFLDYCLFHINSVMSTPVGRAGYRAMIVQPVVGYSGEGLASGRESSLAGELFDRLTDMDVAVIPREYAFKGEAVPKDSPGTASWIRPVLREATQQGLLGVSHLLTTTIRPPRDRGKYQLEMRLIDLATGQVVWSGQGDRIEPRLRPRAVPFLLATGRLASIQLKNDVQFGRLSPGGHGTGGLPLRLSRVEIVPVDQGRGGGTRLGFCEDLDDATDKKIAFRDLFDKRVQLLDRRHVDSVEVVHSLADVPSGHEMRYLTWKLARAILPAGGRITAAEGKEVDISLGLRSGIRPGQRLVVLRRRGAPGTVLANSFETVAAQLIVREVDDVSARAVVDAGSDQTPQVGDIAYARLPQEPKVAVITFQPEHWDLETEYAQSPIVTALAGHVSENKQGITAYVAKRFGRFLESGLVELGIHVVERNEKSLPAIHEEVKRQGKMKFAPERVAAWGKMLGASHLVFGQLSPGLKPRNDIAPSDVRVIDVERGLLVEQVQFNFTRDQFQHWKP